MTVSPTSRSRRPSRWLCSLLLVGMCLTAVITVPGCSGCRRDSAAEKKKKEEEERKKKEEERRKRKPPFEIRALRIQPFDDMGSAVQGKWGHWVSTRQKMKANHYNFQGELLAATVSNSGVPYELERTPFRLRMIRPASLPKGQTKFFENTHFIPRQPKKGEGSTVGLMMHLRGRRGGRMIEQRIYSPKLMAAYQYDIVVLARQADRYAFIKRLDSVDAPWDDDEQLNPSLPYYRVVLPKITTKAPVPLPAHPLVWTTIAYIVWDDIDPGALNLDQQQAMLDWLHWGGQIIVSGPVTLDALRGSFLGKYLPAEAGSSRKLTQSSFDGTNQRFTLTERRRGRTGRLPLTVAEGTFMEAVELKLHAGAQFLPGTDELLAERRVGRGRIVVTAFPLIDRRMINWPNFDNYFNACLLRRPPREFATTANNNSGYRVNWAEPHGNLRFDARLVSNVRYFSRDMSKLLRRVRPAEDTAASTPTPPPTDDDPFGGGSDADPFGAGTVQPAVASPGPERVEQGPAGSGPMPTHLGGDFKSPPLFDNGFRASMQSGVAGWDDFSGTPSEARDALKQAAGINVPSARFVIKVLGAYLLILVPLNWAVFRLIGRVELAWLAAPVIAVGGAVAVVYLAQLDIGFVRSRTEIGLLEIQAAHHRGHLTRYTALYTSLSTNYDLHFDDPSALAQPFAKDPTYQRLVGQRATDVTFARDQNVRLTGFPVKSNSTGMVHSEQMFPLGGKLRLLAREGAGLQVVNETELALKGAGVVRRVGQGVGNPIEVAWIGPLDAGASAQLRFHPASKTATLLPQWNETSETALQSESGELSVRRILDLAQDPQRVGMGDVRLIAWTDAPLKGLDIRPRARQAFHRTLVVAHLRYGPLPDPQPDRNTGREVRNADLSLIP